MATNGLWRTDCRSETRAVNCLRRCSPWWWPYHQRKKMFNFQHDYRFVVKTSNFLITERVVVLEFPEFVILTWREIELVILPLKLNLGSFLEVNRVSPTCCVENCLFGSKSTANVVGPPTTWMRIFRRWTV